MTEDQNIKSNPPAKPDEGSDDGKANSIELYNSPSGGVRENEQAIQDFFQTVSRLGWSRFFAQLPENDILITTPYTKAQLLAGEAAPSCKIVLLSDLPAGLEAVKGRIILFLFYQERAVHLWLKKQNPRFRLYSVFSDLLPNSIYQPRRLVWQQPAEPVAIDAGANGPSPVLLLGTLGSEVSYFADMFTRAGAGTMRQFLVPAIAAAKEVEGSFPIARYIRAVEERFAEEGAYAAYGYTHVLHDCLKAGVFSLDRLIAYLEARNIKVIYYTMRDKIRQAFYAAAFEKRATDSLWDYSDEAKKSYRALPVGSLRVLRHVMPLIEAEIEAKALISNLPNVQVITHEDLMLAPKEVMGAVAKHTGRILNESVDMTWHDVMKKAMPHLEEDCDAATRMIIDRLGLHANAAGSLVSLQKLVAEVVEDRMSAGSEIK